MKTHLEEWMKHRKLTSESLSQKSGIAQKMIDKYVSGVTTPSLEVASILAKNLDVTIDRLVFANPDDTVETHCIETPSIKEAIKLQNYFEENGIEVKVTVFPEEDESFVIVYRSNHIYTIKEVKKIISKMKWLDSRYKSMNIEDRYKGMIISQR